MQLCKSRKWQIIETRYVLAIAFRNQRQHVISAVVPRAERRMRGAARNDSELRKRSRTHESFIRKYLVGRGMIVGQQSNLVEVHRFFHRLHEPEAEQSVSRPHALLRNL